MAINDNFTQSLNSKKELKIKKQKTVQRDLTSFQCVSQKLTKDTVSFGSKNNNANNKITFAGVWKSGPMVTVSHRYFYGTSGNWSNENKVQEESQQYHPYSWEDEPIITIKEDTIERKESNRWQTGSISRQTSEVRSTHPDFKHPDPDKPLYPVVGEALNREWSLYEKQKELSSAAKNFIKEGNNLNNQANSCIDDGNRKNKELKDLFTWDSHKDWKRAKELQRESKSNWDRGKDLIKIRDYIQGEEKELESRRKKGEVVDISVRNKSNPNAEFEHFLKKLNTGEHSAQETVWNLISLPNETMKVADAILISLGQAKQSVISLSDDIKVTMVKGHDVQGKYFVDNVLNGLHRVLK